MKKIIILLLVFFVCAFARRGAEKQPKAAPKPAAEPMVVLTAVPALEALAKEILRGTPIEVINPFGNEISLEEFDGICKQFEEEITALALRTAAVINVRSVIPSEQLFIHVRHRNIRVVEIDCATPLSPILTSLGKIRRSGEVLPFVWTSLSNSIRMAEVLQSDLSALFPEYAKTISANLTDFKIRANTLRNEFVAEFLKFDNFNAVILSRDFDYFLKDIDLFVIESFPPEYDWTAQHSAQFAKILEEQPVGLIINRWETGSPAEEIMQKFSVKTAVLNTGLPAEAVFENGFLELWKKNASAILSAIRE